jgi:hypothetical protein
MFFKNNNSNFNSNSSEPPFSYFKKKNMFHPVSSSEPISYKSIVVLPEISPGKSYYGSRPQL